MRRIIHVNRPMKRAMTNVSQSERILLFGALTIHETPRIVVVWQNRRNSFVYEGDRSRRFSIIINHTGGKKEGAEIHRLTLASLILHWTGSVLLEL